MRGFECYSHTFPIYTRACTMVFDTIQTKRLIIAWVKTDRSNVSKTMTP